jgi:general secretion pathway protein D
MSPACLLYLLPLAASPGVDEVRLDFPETVELRVVVDYLAATLGLNLIYDEAQLKKPLSLRVSQPVPRAELPGLLRTLLRSRGLALVPAEQEGWFRVVAAEQLAAEGGPLRRDLPPPGPSDADVLTFVLPVEHAELEGLRTALTPYLSKPGGALLSVPGSRLLVITDYAANVRRAVELVGMLDVATAATTLEELPVRNQDPAELATRITQLLTEQGRVDKTAPVAVMLSLHPNPVTGGLMAVGLPDEIARARALLERLDQPVVRRTELLQPRYLAAARLRTIIEQLVPGGGAKLAVDEPGNTLIVTARTEILDQIQALLKRFDTAPPESATPLRFYKLLNRRAVDAYATIGTLLMGTPAQSNGTGTANHPEPGNNVHSAAQPAAAAPSAPSGTGVGALQIPPMPSGDSNGGNGTAGAVARVGIQGKDFSLSVDEHTNTIIALATPEMHRQIEQLVKELDKRRPQVLVEVTLVSISVDDSLNLGVELQNQDLDGSRGYELFTSFGLSTINPTDGTRRLAVLPGGTGVLLAPDEVPIIIQALAGNGKTHVYSAPRILVDDNATGTIESVAESPYTSVNASNTVATTAFAGFAKAGTQLQIEPHIAEGDHLEIKYNLTVSSFTGAGSATTPPPRSADTITSTIRVPDGHTVIVGGLLTETLADSTSHVPLIGDVPIVGFLFGVQSHSRSKVRLYAFIRPTILRNEEFEDLKYLSREDLKAADVSDGYPPDRWQYMH